MLTVQSTTVLIALALASCSFEPEPFLETELTTEDRLIEQEAQQDGHVLRSRTMRLNPDFVSVTKQGITEGFADSTEPMDYSLSLPLFDDVVVELKARSVEFDGGVMVLDAKPINDDLGSAQLVLNGSTVSGTIGYNGLIYNITPTVEGNVLVQESDPSRFPSEAEPLSLPVLVLPDGDEGATEDNELRVLILFPRQLSFRCSASNKETTKVDYQAALNRCYQQPESGVRAVVDVDSIEYTSVGADLSVDLAWLKGSAEVRTLRDRYGADLVSMIVPQAGPCGLGYYPGPSINASHVEHAYSVVRLDCAIGNFSLAHELGHNMGMMHDRAVAGAIGSRDCNFGAVFPGRNRLTGAVRTIRSIMAYGNICNNCPRVGHFSHPGSVTVDDEVRGPMGRDCSGNTPGENNLEQLVRGASVVRNYRARPPEV